MTMQGTSQPGELTYTLTGLIVSALDVSDSSYSDTVIAVANGQMYASEPEADTDKLRSYGRYAEGLAVPIGTKLSLKMGGVDYDMLEALGAVSITESGTTPNVVKTIDPPAGGEGLTYFGIIGSTAAINGGLVVIGHAKVKLENVPTITADGEENKFNISEVEAYSYPPATATLYRIKTFETAADFTAPTDGATFAAFFA